MPFTLRYGRAISDRFRGCKFCVTGPGPAALVALRAYFGFREESANLAAQFVLDHVDLPLGIEDAEPELIGHRRVLAEQRALIRAETFVDVVAELQIHPGLPEVHPARLQDAADQRLLVDLQVEDEMRRDRQAVQTANPRAIDAAHAGARHGGEDVPIREHD